MPPPGKNKSKKGDKKKISPPQKLESSEEEIPAAADARCSPPIKKIKKVKPASKVKPPTQKVCVKENIMMSKKKEGDSDHSDVDAIDVHDNNNQPNILPKKIMTVKNEKEKEKISRAQEDAIVTWYREQECLYDRGDPDYRDTTKKQGLYEAQAFLMGMTSKCYTFYIFA